MVKLSVHVPTVVSYLLITIVKYLYIGSKMSNL